MRLLIEGSGDASGRFGSGESAVEYMDVGEASVVNLACHDSLV